MFFNADLFHFENRETNSKNTQRFGKKIKKDDLKENILLRIVQRIQKSFDSFELMQICN